MIDKEVVELVTQIMAKAIICNNAGSDENHHKPHIFVNYYGHVNSLSIRVHENGWEENKDYDVKYDIYLDYNVKATTHALTDILNYLKSLEEKNHEKNEKDT